MAVRLAFYVGHDGRFVYVCVGVGSCRCLAFWLVGCLVVWLCGCLIVGWLAFYVGLGGCLVSVGWLFVFVVALVVLLLYLALQIWCLFDVYAYLAAGFGPSYRPTAGRFM